MKEFFLQVRELKINYLWFKLFADFNSKAFLELIL